METETVAAVVDTLPEEIKSSLIDGIGSIASQYTDIISAVLPVALPVCGVVMAVHFGFRLFRSVVH